MNNDTVLMPHERGWAVLHNGMLTKVYPSRHLAMQKLKDEMSRRSPRNQRTHRSEPTHASRRQENATQRRDQA